MLHFVSCSCICYPCSCYCYFFIWHYEACHSCTPTKFISWYTWCFCYCYLCFIFISTCFWFYLSTWDLSCVYVYYIIRISCIVHYQYSTSISIYISCCYIIRISWIICKSCETQLFGCCTLICCSTICSCSYIISSIQVLFIVFYVIWCIFFCYKMSCYLHSFFYHHC